MCYFIMETEGGENEKENSLFTNNSRNFILYRI